MDNWTCIGVKLEQPQDDVWNKRDLSSNPTQSPRLKNHLLCNFKKYNYCIYLLKGIIYCITYPV